MKKIISIGLWIMGGLFFFCAFLILLTCLFLFSRETTFKMARGLFNILIRIMGIRLRVKGRQHIRKDQTYLIMGNHQSLFDLFVVPSAIPLCFVSVEAAYHFSIPIWGFMIRKWGCIPIERNHLQNAITSLEIARKTLLTGTSIAILPEGHRTLTGKMMPFKKGPFYLAKNAQTDILPFGINGLFDYHPKGRLILKPTRVTLTIGRPIPYEAIKGLTVDEMRQMLFQRISHLSQTG